MPIIRYCHRCKDRKRFSESTAIKRRDWETYKCDHCGNIVEYKVG